ncbi:MAG: hypothetical protein WAM14_16085 [Candidatus Nitrosopolaris sp.]
MRTNNTKVITNALVNKFGNNTIKAGYISIDKQLKPLPIKLYENGIAFNLSKCNMPIGCPIWRKSEFSLKPTLGIIGNVSKPNTRWRKRFTDSRSTSVSLATKAN